MKFEHDDFAIRGEFRGDSLAKLEHRIGNTDLWIDTYSATKSLILAAMQTDPDHRTKDQSDLLELIQHWGQLADDQNQEERWDELEGRAM